MSHLGLCSSAFRTFSQHHTFLLFRLALDFNSIIQRLFETTETMRKLTEAVDTLQDELEEKDVFFESNSEDMNESITPAERN